VAVAVALTLLLVAGVAAVVLSRSGGDADGGAELRAAQEFVSQADGYSFEQRTKTRTVTGDPDGAGSDTTTRGLTTGTVAAPDRWHLVQDMGGDFGEDMPAVETIRVGDTLYSTGMMGPAGVGPAWLEMPIPDELPAVEDLATMFEDSGFDEDDPYVDESRLQLALMAYLADGSGDPSQVTRVVLDAERPVVEEERGDGGVVVRAQLPPAPELAELGDIPPVDVFLHLDREDRPVEARFTAKAGSASAEVVVTFSDWGDVDEVRPPAAADIDVTPWISEEALGELDPSSLLAPRALPEGMALVSAMVMDDSFFMVGEEEADCPTVSLTYGSEEDLLVMEDPAELTEEEMAAQYEDMRYLDVSLSSSTCYPDEEYGSGYFSDEIGGLPASGEEGYWEVQVGESIVTVSSTLDDEAVGALVTSLEPVTVEELAGSIPAWATKAYADGYGSPFGFGMGAVGMAGGWITGGPVF
jgi:hypothetical protein